MADILSNGEAIRRASVIIGAAIVGGSMILSWGMGRGGERYQIAAVGNAVVRLDVESGDMLACTQQQCVKVDDGITEQRFGPVGVVIDKSKERQSLPAPEAPKSPTAPTPPAN